MSDSGYNKLAIHRWMLRDSIRNEAYRRALTQVVKPGHVVLDMGAGTGILSIFAAQAGARKVFAVERTGIAMVANQIVASNGLEDRIDVMKADLEDVDLPEKVDVIISEWMGGLGVDENMLAPLVMARDRWLKPGGIIVPGRVTAMLAPAQVLDLEEGLDHWRSRPHGVDLSVIAGITANETFATHADVTIEDLVAEPQMMWTHDAYTCSLQEADQSFKTKLSFEAAHAGRISGFVTWFTAELADGITLTNAVGAPPTHWGRLLFPLASTVDVAKGTPIHVELHCEQSSPGSCEFCWRTRIGDRPLEEHDTRLSRQSQRAR